MPYCAPSENGTQCQTCSRDPSARGSRLPAHPGISSLVRRGASRGSLRRYLTLSISTPVMGVHQQLERTPGATVPYPSKPAIAPTWLHLTAASRAVIQFRNVLNYSEMP